MPQCFTIMNNDNNHNTIQQSDYQWPAERSGYTNNTRTGRYTENTEPEGG